MLCLAAMAVQAQNAQVATLFHKNGAGNTETFYGDQALISALNAGNNGDVITLSGGAFQAPAEISKTVTIRGAGMVANPTLGTLPYSETITGPRITQATVASETTDDGLLSVDITVSAK